MTAASPKPKHKRPPVLKWKFSNLAKQTAAIATFAVGVKPQLVDNGPTNKQDESE
jgi:hypothetical protein